MTKKQIVKNSLNTWYNGTDHQSKELFDNCNFSIKGLIEDILEDIKECGIYINYNNIVEILTKYIKEG